mmetsp:Transcript_6863/g.11020  ORF Transcript_6863/g.11020 Transcript_6863/m.11020 type:complete len:486 (+) Transcript_6863:53-1510(+)
MTVEHLDVVIVGSGISGISAAYHLQKECPNKRFAIMESRQSLGGTWDLFRYPGIRSDSDMFSLGFGFKPWRGAKAIAEGHCILDYLKETSRENSIDKHIRYGHALKAANWSSADACWELRVEREEGNLTLRCNVLLMCAGYYSYESGHTPDFPQSDTFSGTIVHPQQWPENLDYANKKIVVIGSGATAVTLVPEMSKTASHVVMLQRSPTYYASWPAIDGFANFLRRFLPERIAYRMARAKNIASTQFLYHLSRSRPEMLKRLFISGVRKQLSPGYDVDKHFTPRYTPWEQRMCLVPDGDLFESINSDKASIVTDHIDSFTEHGVLLTSGQVLEADIIVTATGLKPTLLGNVDFTLDATPIDFTNTYSYKGLMYSNVPNMVSTFGYINNSWTLRADLTADFVCRLINHMDTHGARQCTPRLRDEDRNMPARDWISDFSSGYMKRLLKLYPKQGDREPWINPQRYSVDKKLIGEGDIDDGVLEFNH